MNQKIEWSELIVKGKLSAQRRMENELADIEKALEAGFSYQDVIAHLNANGFALKPASFRNTLYRARQRKALQTQKSDPVVGTPSHSSVAPESPPKFRLPVKPAAEPRKLIDWDPQKPLQDW